MLSNTNILYIRIKCEDNTLRFILITCKSKHCGSECEMKLKMYGLVYRITEVSMHKIVDSGKTCNLTFFIHTPSIPNIYVVYYLEH